MRLHRGLMAVLATLAMGAAARADILIDDFADEQNVTVTNGGSNPKTAGGTLLTSGAIGGERDILVTRTTGTRSLQGDVFENTVAYIAAVGVKGSVTLVYDGTDGDQNVIDYTGLGDVNLVAAGNPLATALYFTHATSSSGMDFFVTIYQDMTHFATASFSVPAGTEVGTDYYLLLTSFTLNGSGSTFESIFEHVGAITVTMSTDALAGDGEFNRLDVRTVPEPGSLALLGMGLFGTGFAFYGRRKMAKNA